MSWQASVTGRGPQAMPEGWFGVRGVFWRPLIRSPSENRRGSLTTAAVSGASTGTLMTSIRQREEFSGCGVSTSSAALPPGVSTQPASSAAGRTPPVPWT
jgi:hypothetical protein